MLADELVSRLKLQAAYEEAKAAALKAPSRTTPKPSDGLNGNEADPSLCPKCSFAHLLCECEDDEEDDEDEDEVEVTPEEWGDAIKLIFESLDSLDRVVEDDRVELPEGMKFLLMSRRIDIYDFLTEHATAEQIEEYNNGSDLKRSDK